MHKLKGRNYFSIHHVTSLAKVYFLDLLLITYTSQDTLRLPLKNKDKILAFFMPGAREHPASLSIHNEVIGWVLGWLQAAPWCNCKVHLIGWRKLQRRLARTMQNG